MVNPKYGTAFEVPADWEVQRPGVFTFFEDKEKGDGSAYIGFSGASFLKPDYCTSDNNGYKQSHALAGSGTKGENGAKDTQSIARGNSATFVFGGYTDQSKAAEKYLRIGKAKPFTTASGVKGSVATSYVVRRAQEEQVRHGRQGHHVRLQELHGQLRLVDVLRRQGRQGRGVRRDCHEDPRHGTAARRPDRGLTGTNAFGIPVVGRG